MADKFFDPKTTVITEITGEQWLYLLDILKEQVAEHGHGTAQELITQLTENSNARDMNSQRRQRANDLLTWAEDVYENGDERSNLIDILTDLRHLCAADKTLDFANCVEMSEINFEEEK